jgi:hypothetical protein
VTDLLPTARSNGIARASARCINRTAGNKLGKPLGRHFKATTERAINPQASQNLCCRSKVASATRFLRLSRQAIQVAELSETTFVLMPNFMEDRL